MALVTKASALLFGGHRREGLALARRRGPRRPGARPVPGGPSRGQQPGIGDRRDAIRASRSSGRAKAWRWPAASACRRSMHTTPGTPRRQPSDSANGRGSTAALGELVELDPDRPDIDWIAAHSRCAHGLDRAAGHRARRATARWRDPGERHPDPAHRQRLAGVLRIRGGSTGGGPRLVRTILPGCRVAAPTSSTSR